MGDQRKGREHTPFESLAPVVAIMRLKPLHRPIAAFARGYGIAREARQR